MNETMTRPAVSYQSLLQNRNYAALWLGQLVSVFGDRLHQIALLVLVGSLTGNNLTQVGLVLATIGVPSLLFGLFAGALVDRWNRRHVMIAADFIRFLLVVSIPTMATMGLAWIYVITFLLTTATLFFRPAKDGSIPNIVPKDGLMTANSLSSATDTILDVLGYPLAGALVGGLSGLLEGGHGINIAFYIDAGTYLFSAIMIYKMTVPHNGAEQAHAGIGGLVRMVGEGLRFVRGHAVLLTNILVVAAGALVGGGVATLCYGYAASISRDALTTTGFSSTTGFSYSVLQAAIGLGSVIGGLAVGRWGYRYAKGRLILSGLAITGGAYVTLFLISNLWLAAFMLMVGGIGNMLFFIPSMTLVQQSTPDMFRGRVLSFRSMLIAVALITSNVLLGIGAQRWGVQAMLMVSGGLLMLIGLLAFLLPAARDAN